MKSLIFRDIKITYPDNWEKGEALGYAMKEAHNRENGIIKELIFTETEKYINTEVTYLDRKETIKPQIGNILNKKCIICNKNINGKGIFIANIHEKIIYCHEECFKIAVKNNDKPIIKKRVFGSAYGNTK